MKFTSFAGTTFASLNVTASLPNDTPDRDRNPNVLTRLNASGLINGVAGGTRTIPVYFQVKPTFDIEQTILALIAALDLDNRDARSLVGQLNDGSTNVKILARPGSYIARPGDTKGLLVPFYSDDPRWIAASATTETPPAFSAAGTTVIALGGQGRVNPLVKIGWSVQRPSSSATVGWKYRRSITITNSDSKSLYNQVIQLGPLDTAALVTAGKMQADCDDLVPFDEQGIRQRRVITGANSRGTFLTFVVPELAGGASKTYDIGYGNPNAAHDVTVNGFPYSFAGSPTIDVSGLDGQATAGSVSTLSTGVTMDPNEFLGATMLLTGASTAIGGQYRRVGSHTLPGVVTVSRNFSTTPDTTTGYVLISGPFMGDGGLASAKTTTSLTDGSQVWNINEWIGARVETVTLSTTMGTVTDFATVTSNTATVLSFSAWNSGGTPAANVYRIYKRNGNYIYRIEETQRTHNNYRGRWRLNKGQTNPTQIWFASDGAPAAWSPTIYNPGNASNDFNQKRVRDVDIGGGDKDYFAEMDISLARKDSQRFREEGFANAVAISMPLGILGIRQDYRVQNPDGMARVFFGCRDRGGEDWESYHEYSTVQASLTARPVAYYDLTSVTPNHLINALTSDDDADIDKTETGVARLLDSTILEVRMDTRNLVVTDIATATEDSVYDLTLSIRRSTNASETAGDDLLRIGQNEQHVFLPSGYKLWVGEIGEAPYAARIYNGSTFVRSVPWPVIAYHIDNNATGDATRYVSTDLLPLQPGNNTLRVSDPDGAIGTVDITLVYNASYL